MKGLELCETYYHECGAPMIRDKFPQYEARIGAGLVGDGSECYGFDDDISQDHDWGPGFCLWLDHDDYKTIGEALQQEYERLPRTFHGFKRRDSNLGDRRVGVFEIGSFYSRFIGIPHCPETLEQWLFLPENHLSACTNGRVFSDPLGTFSEIREALLDFYPEDIRMLKMAARCMTSAQSGQYNFMRSIRHKEYYAAQYAETTFCFDIMSLLFLLNRRYAPFYKWRHRAVGDLPALGKFLHQKISHLTKTSVSEEKNRMIEEISTAIIQRLQEEGLSHSESDFLLDHGPIIQQKIRDENLRKRNVWIG
ncbi:MAG: DUF4037 domain-containing protein [Desulfatiglans sp.]|jgi:hypothetical protein|nr:DUF4037 domain-containing protein [Thermodesulfobacteriota bacterium]MEE4354749.1 DUF4037 domain-containing protein [Desulfatiglans sp.]